MGVVRLWQCPLLNPLLDTRTVGVPIIRIEGSLKMRTDMRVRQNRRSEACCSLTRIIGRDKIRILGQAKMRREQKTGSNHRCAPLPRAFVFSFCLLPLAMRPRMRELVHAQGELAQVHELAIVPHPTQLRHVRNGDGAPNPLAQVVHIAHKR